MAEHDFEPLFTHYLEILAQMSRIFNSHQFILRLARDNQSLYIAALNTYANLPNSTQSRPFNVVHGILARHLTSFDNIRPMGKVKSTDIFGDAGESEQWQKIE